MNNIKILTHLLNNKEEQFTINQISKDLSINYRIAHTQVKLLEKEGLIKTLKAGKSLLCSLTGKFNEKIFLAEFERQKTIKKEIKQIRSRFEDAKQNFILLLFGSYAKNKQTKHSDIDLLAVTDNEKELKEIVELIPKNVHLTTISYNSFRKMQNVKELSVVSEAIKNNIILIGIEDYYRLVEGVK